MLYTDRILNALDLYEPSKGGLKKNKTANNFKWVDHSDMNYDNWKSGNPTMVQNIIFLTLFIIIYIFNCIFNRESF